jgi:aminopeptidase N
MGRATFDAFLRDYVTRFSWEEADTESFRALAEEHCGCDLGGLFEEWVYE